MRAFSKKNTVSDHRIHSPKQPPSSFLFFFLFATYSFFLFVFFLLCFVLSSTNYPVIIVSCIVQGLMFHFLRSFSHAWEGKPLHITAIVFFFSSLLFLSPCRRRRRRRPLCLASNRSSSTASTASNSPCTFRDVPCDYFEKPRLTGQVFSMLFYLIYFPRIISYPLSVSLTPHHLPFSRFLVFSPFTYFSFPILFATLHLLLFCMLSSVAFQRVSNVPLALRSSLCLYLSPFLYFTIPISLPLVCHFQTYSL